MLNSGNQSTGGLSGLALKAWALIDSQGASATLVKGSNVSGVTWNAAGDFTVTFAVAMGSANYVYDLYTRNDGVPGANFGTSGTRGASCLAGSARLQTIRAGAAAATGLTYVAFYE